MRNQMHSRLNPLARIAILGRPRFARFSRRITLAPLLAVPLFASAAAAATKPSNQIPSIQAPPAQNSPKSPAPIPSIQAPAQPAARPATPPVRNAGDAPVMLPVAATQRELSPEIQKNLRLLTGQNSLEARQIGASGLLQQGSAAVSALRQILTNQPAPIVVMAVALAIPEVQDPPTDLVEPLIQQLAAEDPEVRAAVVAALVSYRNHDLPAKLRAVIAGSQNPQPARLAAVSVLGQLADRDAIGTLIALLETADEPMRQPILAALRPLTGVDFGLDCVRWQQWWQANRNRRPQEWAGPVIASLTEEKRAALEEIRSLRAQLAKAMREMYYLLTREADRTAHIILCLRHEVPEVRLVGVDLVNNLIPMTERQAIAPEVREQVRKLISDPSAPVRQHTVWVLRDLRNPEDAPLLLEALKTETDSATAQDIARALGRLGSRDAVPVLLEKLQNGDVQMAMAAAAGLGMLCQKSGGVATPEQLDEVVKAFQARMASAEDPAFRRTILDEMARIADDRFRQQIVAALASKDPDLRQSAVRAFVGLNNPDDAEKYIAPRLDGPEPDPEPGVREAACIALGKIGTPSQLPALLRHCNDQLEPSVSVRQAAEDAAVSIMLRMDGPALRADLERLAAAPNQLSILAAVLDKARVQAANLGADNVLQPILLRALAAARYAAGQKDAALKLWVQVVTAQPADTPASTMLAKVLVELSSPDLLATTIQQIADAQSGALANVLLALGKQVQASRTAGQAPAGVLTAMAESLRKIDTSTWSQPNKDSLRTFIDLCAAAEPAAAASNDPPVQHVAATAPASAPATMAGRPLANP